MIRAIIPRVLTLWLSVTIVFFALRILPGEALQAELVLAGADAQSIAAQRATLGLDRPTLTLYLEYMGGLMRGDLGISLATRQPVVEILAINLPPTLTLAFSAFVIAIAVGLILGIVTVVYRFWGRLGHGCMALLLSVPIYWSGTLAIYVFSVILDWLPSGGGDGWGHLVLPSAVLGIHTSAAIGRATQLALTESFQADYIRTARAKGLRERRVIFHALRVSCVPIITTVGLQGGFLLGGTVITEMLFVRNGIGRMMLDATQRRDYPVLLGGVLFTTVAYIVVNTLADILSRQVLDPRCAFIVMLRSLFWGVAIIAVVLLLPLLSPYEPHLIQTQSTNAAPDSIHWLGTDSFGRDVLSRLMHGAPITLGRALMATILTCAIGGLIGTTSTVFGLWWDAFVLMLVNAWLAIPSLVVALVVVTLIGQGEEAIILAVVASQVGVYTRYARSVALSTYHQPYLESTRALGAGNLWIFWRHIVPNAFPQLVGLSGVIFAYSILTVATLGFIGISGDVGQPEWGAILADGRQSLRAAPWVSLSAGVAITLVVFVVNTVTARWVRG